MTVTHCITLQTSIPDERDDFSDFRANCVELLRDIIFLVGSLNCFTEVRVYQWTRWRKVDPIACS